TLADWRRRRARGRALAVTAPDLSRLETVRAVARRFRVSPQHGLGQNFLVDREVRDAIVASLPASPGQLVEIGCGLGSLSQGLLEAGHPLLGIEIDPACVAALGLLQAQFPEFKVVLGDAVRLDPAQLAVTGPYTVVGNLPYQITGAILPRLMAWQPAPVSCLLLVQREVARRLAAPVGDWSLASLALRLVADVELQFDIPPDRFWPSPKVHSSLVTITPKVSLAAGRSPQLLRLARPIFQQRRKQLHHGLANALGVAPAEAADRLRAVGIDPQRRPGTLDEEEWLRLLGSLGPGEEDSG
ncbi:MAG: 16S rRNA (adenine(1518)-N(6)/adenine(1519)-N(6))-dimethyltransferase RsmA, partial [Candidatus Dormibacteria bacterium]